MSGCPPHLVAAAQRSWATCGHANLVDSRVAALHSLHETLAYTIRFHYIGDEHILFGCIQHSICSVAGTAASDSSAAQPSEIIQRFMTVWEQEKVSDDHKTRLERLHIASSASAVQPGSTPQSLYRKQAIASYASGVQPGFIPPRYALAASQLALAAGDARLRQAR